MSDTPKTDAQELIVPSEIDTEAHRYNGQYVIADFARSLERENAELRKQLEWQPIETAPKDGRVLIFCDDGGNRWTDNSPGYWEENGCGRPPIAWRELPEPFSVSKAEQEWSE